VSLARHSSTNTGSVRFRIVCSFRLLDIFRRAQLKGRLIHASGFLAPLPNPSAHPRLTSGPFLSVWALGNAFGLRLLANALEGQKRFSFGFNCN
jgi:hypothetical protein